MAVKRSATRWYTARACKVKDGEQVKLGQLLAEWDPYTYSILTEIGGTVQFKDLQEGITLNEEVDEVTGLSRWVVADAPDEKRQPTFVVKGAKASKRYLLPRGAHLMIQDGDEVGPGDVLAKIPKESTRTKDITGGLPRVVELFEARKPRETAIISEIDGVVRFGEVVKGQRKIYVTADNGEEKEYSVPRGIHVNVQEGERLRAGDPLMDGPLNPHDILDVLGEKELQKYLVNEIQEVYRLQGVAISRQAHRSDCAANAALGAYRRSRRQHLPAGAASRSLPLQRGEGSRGESRRPSAARPSAAAGHHQGVAVHRQLHLGCQLPGDDARAHRSLDQRGYRQPARAQGERDRRTLDPGGHGPGVLPQRAAFSGTGRSGGAGAAGSFGAEIEAAERELELMRQEGEAEEMAAE